MTKNLNNLKWSSVAVDGFPVSMTEKFDGFVGLEECTDYGMDKENSRSKKKKQQKRKSTSNNIEKTEVPSKKFKETYNKRNKKVNLSNGFIVEVCTTTKPSLTNEISPKKSKIEKQTSLKSNNYNISNKKTNNKKQKLSTLARVDEKENDKNNKPKLGDLPRSTSDLTPEDMLTWAEFKLPEPIIKALTELGFKQPTKIQLLSLPAAIHGRRDILGAAETGSGKTLAFGLPILTGILKLKEKAETKGLDVYDIPYKKNSNKNKIAYKKQIKKKEAKTNFVKNKKKTEVTKCKESSEDDCNSGDDNDFNSDDKEKSNDNDFIEEIEVPIRKRKPSEDEGNDNNYIHLSDMLDSDDLAETSSDEDNDENYEINQDDRVGDKSSENDANVKGDINSDDSIVDEEIPDVNVKKNYESHNNDMEIDEHREDCDNKQGIGCVKVVDDVEIPGQVVTRTGKPLYALILTPTRELAIQISRHLIAAAKYTGIRVATIVGGMAAVKQERVLRSGPEVVVATPGRLWELINEGQPHLQQLDSVKFLAIDETDRMIERGHFEELHPLLERLNVDDASRSARQNFVFSATLTMVHALPAHMKGKKVTKRGKIINRKIEKMTSQQKVNRLIKMIGMTDPKVVDITTQNLGTAETLTESRIICEMEHKDAYLYYIIKRHPGRTIVFCNSISSVRRLAQLLKLLNCHPLPLHANMPQRQRLKNLERFRDDRHGILIATDVAARGLDIPRVDHVIHYQVPRTAENYVHRSGRTARASNEGLAVLMLQPSEAALYSRLCSTLQRTSEVPIFPVDPLILAPLKELVAVARDLDALEVKKRRSAQAHGWRDRAAREMDIIIDDDDVPVKQVDPSIDKALQAKKRQLNTLLSCPIYPRGFSFKYPTLNETTTFSASEENALQVMKKALETGRINKQKRQSKNASLLRLQKAFKKINHSAVL